MIEPIRSAFDDWQTQLELALLRQCSEHVECLVGHQGRQIPVTAHWSDRLGIWVAFRRSSHKFYWNAFGLQRPSPNAVLPITCEINLPMGSPNPRLGGTWNKAADGTPTLAHTGRLHGVDRDSLLEYVGRDLAFQIQHWGKTSVVTLGQLDQPDLVASVASFVRMVGAYKSLAKGIS